MVSPSRTALLIPPHPSLGISIDKLALESGLTIETADQFLNKGQEITLIPLLTAQGGNGLNLCVDATEAGGGGIIVGMSRLNDKVSARLLRQCGAQHVIDRRSPMEALLSLQVEQKNTATDTGTDQTKLLLSVIQGLDEGIVILDDQGKILFCNDTATKSLGGLVLQDPSNRALFESKLKQAGETSSEAQEFDFRNFSGTTKISAIRGSGGQPLGFVASLIDKRSVQRLSEGLSQGERTHSILLLAAAACLKLLRTSHLGTPGKPLELLEKTLLESVDFSDIQRAINTSCEILDAVLSPLTAIKVGAVSSSVVAASAPEVFRLLGLLLFTATDFAGPGGEVHITSERVESSGFTILTMVAKSIRPERGMPYDLVLQRIRLSREMIFARDGSLKKLPVGLQEVRNILQKLQGTFKYRELGDEAIEYILQLPNKTTGDNIASPD